MDVFQYAIEMENETELYYKGLAKKTQAKELRIIFDWLAGEEVKHAKIFDVMRRSGTPQLMESSLLGDAKKIFKKMSKRSQLCDLDVSQTRAYEKAKKLEQKAMDFYLQKSEEVQDEEQKQLLIKIAEEEKRHYFLLDNIIDFISRPQVWLENAEWNCLEKI